MTFRALLPALACAAVALMAAPEALAAGGPIKNRHQAMKGLADPAQSAAAVRWLAMPEHLPETLKLLSVLLASESHRRTFSDIYGDGAVPALVTALDPVTFPQIVVVYWLALSGQEATPAVTDTIRERLRAMPARDFAIGVQAWEAAGDRSDASAQIDAIRRVGRSEAVSRGVELGERGTPGARESAIRLVASAAMMNRGRALEAVRAATLSREWRAELSTMFVAMRQADPMIEKARARAIRTRNAAIRALVNDRRNGRLHFYMLLSERDATVRRELLADAGQVLGPPLAMRTLIEVLSHDPDWQVRVHAFRAIRALDPLPGEQVREVAVSQPPRLAILLSVLAHSLDPEASFETRTERIGSLGAFHHQLSRRFGDRRYGAGARAALSAQLRALREDTMNSQAEWRRWWDRNRDAFRGGMPESGHEPAYGDGATP